MRASARPAAAETLDAGRVDRAQVRVVADEDVAVADADRRRGEPQRAVDDQRQHVALRHDVGTDRDESAVRQHDGRGKTLPRGSRLMQQADAG